MKFNNNKCWILHLEQRNAGHNIHWERSAQTVGPFQLKMLYFSVLFSKVVHHPGERAVMLDWFTQRQIWEGIWCAAIVKKGCRILSPVQWWISGEMCSKPMMKCSPDRPLKTLLTLHHAKHTASLPNQGWGGRTSCLKSDFYINLTMLWSLTHGCWTLSLCCSLKKQPYFER